MTTSIAFHDRSLTVCTLDHAFERVVTPPFTVLLPAFSEGERQRAVQLAAVLLERDCVQFCTVGPEAEALHDAIDDIVIDANAIGTLTTWDEDVHEAFEYLLFAAGSQTPLLIAAIGDHPDLVTRLNEAVEAELNE